MAAAARQRHHPSRPAQRAARPARPRAVPRGRAAAGRPAIRWDRLGRVALLFVLALVLLLYVGPAKSWWSTWNQAKDKRAEVQRLQAENQSLRREKRLLTQPSSLEREARAQGMVRRGERSFVLEGLPKGP
jgi:cell division protein FtsB